MNAGVRMTGGLRSGVAEAVCWLRSSGLVRAGCRPATEPNSKTASDCEQPIPCSRSIAAVALQRLFTKAAFMTLRRFRVQQEVTQWSV